MRRTLPVLILGAVATTSTSAAADSGPAAKWNPGHYVFIGIDPGPIEKRQLFDPKFRGIQKAYNWNKIETGRDRYDWSEIDADLRLLAASGKQLAFQIQYKTFVKGTTAVPDDIVNGEAEFGRGRTYISHSASIYPSIWNPKVAARFHKFIRELGKRYDKSPSFGFVNLPETAPSPSGEGKGGAGLAVLKAAGYTPENYIDAVKQNMKVLAEAFPDTVKVQFINWGPPGANEAWAGYGATIGVGVGGPDLHPDREIASYPVIKRLDGKVPVCMAVQHEDYYRTPKNHASGLLDLRRTLAFAEEMKVNYIFWCSSPKAGFQQLLALIHTPDFPQDPAGGLRSELPAVYQTSSPHRAR